MVRFPQIRLIFARNDWVYIAPFVSHALSYLQFIIIISGVGLCPLGTAATFGLLYKPQMIDEGDCGAVGGMKITVFVYSYLFEGKVYP
jgi:hypothetical protein